MEKENNKIKVEKLEESIQGLESLVKRLESDELPLAEALKEFERGIKLTRECQKALKEAEQNVEILIKNTDSEDLQEFHLEEE